MSDDFLPRVDPVADFYQRAFHYTPRLWATHALIALNVAVFVLMVATGVSPMEPLVSDLLKWGANYGPLTTHGEWWRLLTCTFLHIGVLHIAMNMYALWSLGRFVERLLGQCGYLVVYLLSGLAGSLATTTWSPQVTSAGASGAIFGLFGVIFGYLLRNRRTIPPAILKGLLRSGGTFLLLNLAIGFTVPSIDMAGHLGGLVGGFFLGLLIAAPLTDAAHLRRPLRNALTALIGVIALGAYAITLAPVSGFNDVFTRAAKTDNEIDSLINDNLEKNRTGAETPQQLADVIRTQAIPSLQKTQNELAGLNLKANEDRLRQLLTSALQAHQAELKALADVAVDGDADKVAALKAARSERNQRNDALEAFIKKLNAK